MNEEKQIEEIAHVLCGMKSGCDSCMFNKERCFEYKDAERLCNAGYRKQSENVKEIFTEIDTALEHEAFDFGTRMRIQIYLKNLKQKYLGGNDDEMQ